MRLLGWLAIVILVNTCFSSSLLSKTINADGSKEFHIMKKIRHNTCNCKCRCIPDPDDHFSTSPPTKFISTESVENENQATADPSLSGTSILVELETSTQEEITKAVSTTTPESLVKVPSNLNSTEKEKINQNSSTKDKINEQANTVVENTQQFQPLPHRRKESEDSNTIGEKVSADSQGIRLNDIKPTITMESRELSFLTTEPLSSTKDVVINSTLSGIFTEFYTNSVTPKTENETSLKPSWYTTTDEKISMVSIESSTKKEVGLTQVPVSDSVYLKVLKENNSNSEIVSPHFTAIPLSQANDTDNASSSVSISLPAIKESTTTIFKDKTSTEATLALLVDSQITEKSKDQTFEKLESKPIQSIISHLPNSDKVGIQSSTEYSTTNDSWHKMKNLKELTYAEGPATMKALETSTTGSNNSTELDFKTEVNRIKDNNTHLTSEESTTTKSPNLKRTTVSEKNNIWAVTNAEFSSAITAVGSKKETSLWVPEESPRDHLNRSSATASIQDFEKVSTGTDVSVSPTTSTTEPISTIQKTTLPERWRELVLKLKKKIEDLKKLKSSMRAHVEHNLDPISTKNMNNFTPVTEAITTTTLNKRNLEVSEKLDKEEIRESTWEATTIYSVNTDSAFLTSLSLNNSKISSTPSSNNTEIMAILTTASTASISETPTPQNSSTETKKEVISEETSLKFKTIGQLNEKSEESTKTAITSDLEQHMTTKSSSAPEIIENATHIEKVMTQKTTKAEVFTSEDFVSQSTTFEVQETNKSNTNAPSLETTPGVSLNDHSKTEENTTVTSTVEPISTIDVTITTPNFTTLLTSTTKPIVDIKKPSPTPESDKSMTIMAIFKEEKKIDSEKNSFLIDRYAKQIDAEVTNIEKTPLKTATSPSVTTSSAWSKANAIGSFVTSLKDSSEEVEQTKKSTSLPASTDNTKPFVTIVGNSTNGTELNVKMPLNENSIAPPALAFAIQNAKAQFKNIDNNSGHASVDHTDVLTSLISELIGGAHNVVEKTQRMVNTVTPLDSTLLTVTPSSHSFIPLHVSEPEVRRAEQRKLLEESAEYEKRIREERIRLEQAKHLREEKMRIERLHEKERERIMRAEILKRKEEMQKQMEELRAAEERQHAQLEEQKRIEEERLRLIAKKKAEVEFAEITSTSSYSLTKTEKVHYKLRPSQCAAISKFTRVFKITNPSDWIAKNCLFAKKYFPQASCSQIRALIESCFTFL